MPTEPPTDADRDRLAADLRERAELVRRDRWEPYAEKWSSGEVLGGKHTVTGHVLEEHAEYGCPGECGWQPSDTRLLRPASVNEEENR